MGYNGNNRKGYDVRYRGLSKSAKRSVDSLFFGRFGLLTILAKMFHAGYKDLTSPESDTPSSKQSLFSVMESDIPEMKNDSNMEEEEMGLSGFSFDNLDYLYSEMEELYDEILEDKRVCRVLNKEIHVSHLGGKDVKIDMKILIIFFYDIVKCLYRMGHTIDFDKPDSYILPIVLNLNLRETLISESDFYEFMTRDSIAQLYKAFVTTFEERVKSDGKEFLFTQFTKNINDDFCWDYYSIMIEISDYIKKANPTNEQLEDSWISYLGSIRS